MNNDQFRPVLVLAGATASGKTALSIELADYIPIEIISADARQIYKHLDVGTSKPTQEQQRVCRHHCIDMLDPSESYSAALYASDARNALKSIPPDKLPVFVGGSGLYISAAIDGFSHETAEPNSEMRFELLNILHNEGRDFLYAELAERDPRAAEKYSDKNPRRIMRALEFIRTTGKLFSATWDVHRDSAEVIPLFINVSQPVGVLNQLIAQRCEYMWNNGLVEETMRVLDMGVPQSAQSLQSVGYREAISFINKSITESEALEKMKLSTRRYAKRQRTWFRSDLRYQRFESPNVTEIIAYLKSNALARSFVV
ncbi:MAG: tRNA (adenosine(37)-N6)-dimethylallyltransferase MiaA [Ignavibacteria bacterium]|nr:tRNA (adenosine(37)-N6)-dimethylallyltransferase MiaA [Ignavibacteria bacterium]